MDFFLADEDKLFATAYDPLSWSEGFSLSFFTWSVDNEKSWSAYERYVKDDTEVVYYCKPWIFFMGPTSTMENFMICKLKKGETFWPM